MPGERWPTLIEVVEALRSQHQRLRAIVATLTAEQLAAPPSGAAQGSVRHRIVHALHDETSHGGEIWPLCKMQNAGKG
ncbi:MAG TPA: DinB family protein [Phycisphaerae bacterium]|nr:DinB family protein [Phycisphaerae bacterium]